MSKTNEDREVLKAKITCETAKIPWKDLQRFFAQGRVITVAAGFDLVEIAALAASDRSDEMASLISQGAIAKVSDAQARMWLESDALLWANVVKPWVFVQELRHLCEARPN